MKRQFLVLACAAFAGMAWGETYTWKGGAGSLTDSSNWTASGGGHAVPSNGDDLVFPGGSNVVTDWGALTTVGSMTLTGNTELQWGSAGGTCTVNGTISGAGSLTSTGNASANCYLVLKGNNTFSGGYTNYGGQTKVAHNNALGTGGATFLSNGKPQHCLCAGASVTVPNNMNIGCASNWHGPITATGYTLTLSGTIHFINDAIVNCTSCVRFTGGTTVFSGDVYLDWSAGTGFVGNGVVIFENPVRPKDGTSNAFGVQFDSSSPAFTFKGSGNAIGNIWWNTSATLTFAAPNALKATSQLYANTTASASFYTDLGGKDQLVDSVHDNGKAIAAPAQFQVKSETPATISMRASGSRTFSGAFNGAVTLCWNPTASTSAYTIQKTPSLTTGGLIVSNGTVNVCDGASMPNITSVTVAPGAHLSFAAGSACSASLDTLVLGSTSGTSFEIADGATIKVGTFYTVDANGVRTKMPAFSTFTSAQVPALGAGVTIQTGEETLTWVGPSGGSWHEPSNWEGNAVPTAGSKVLIPDGISSIVLASDAPLAGFTSQSTVPLAITGEGRFVLRAGDVVFDAAADLSISTEIAGEGRLVSHGPGVLTLAHANTYTGGTLREGDCKNAAGTAFVGGITIAHNNALGTGPAAFNSHAGLRVSSTVSQVANDISWTSAFSSSPQFFSHLVCDGAGGLAFTGTLDFSRTSCARAYATNAGKTITYAGVVLQPQNTESWVTDLIAKNGTHVFSSPLTGNGVLTSDSWSIWRFAAPANELTILSFYTATSGSRFYTDVADAFLPTTRIWFFSSASASEQLWDLGGNDQTIDSAYDKSNVAASNHKHVIQTPDGQPARLTMKASADCAYTGFYKGPLTVCWMPTEARTLTLSGVQHPMTGALVVSNGTVVVTDGASFNHVSEVEVAPGATLSFASGTTLNANLRKITLGEGARLVSAEAMGVAADELWTVDADGVATLCAGGRTYGHAELGALDGVTVGTARREEESQPTTWSAAGGADSTFAQNANWTVVPDFTKAGTVATFANAGTVATATTDVPLKGIVFAAVNAFELAGPGTLSLFEAGLAATTPVSGSGAFVISAPLDIQTSSAWSIASGAAVTLSGPFSGGEELPGTRTVKVSGGGTLNWRSTDCTYAGNLVFSNVVNNVYGAGWGASTEGRVSLYDIPQSSSHNYFRNVTLNQAIDLYPEGVLHDNWGSGDFFVTPAGVTNVFNGLVSLCGPNYVRFQCGSGSRCVFAGGVVQASGTTHCPVPLGAGWFVITNTPVSVPYWWSDTTGHTILAVPGNRFSGGIHLGNGSASGVTSSIRLDVDDAVALCPELYLSSESSIDLNGHDLRVVTLATGNAASTPRVTSETPATLFVTNVTAGGSHPVRLEGAASFVKSGEKTLTLTGVSTSTGVVEVAGGALVIGAGASWPKASRAVVDKWTRLELTDANALGRGTDVHIDAANLSLLKLVNERTTYAVHDLYIGGARQRPGTWGATGSTDAQGRPPKYVDDAHFTGPGVLSVVSGIGTMVIVR